MDDLITREAIRSLIGMVHIFTEQIKDLQTRVNDLEQAMGEHQSGYLFSVHTLEQAMDDVPYQVRGFDATGKPALFDVRTFFSGESQEGGNSGFEQAEEKRLEREPWDRIPFEKDWDIGRSLPFGIAPSEEELDGIADNAKLEETGTHPPNCSCAWCETW